MEEELNETPMDSATSELEDVVLLEEPSPMETETIKISTSNLVVERVLHATTISIALVAIAVVILYQYYNIGFVLQYPKLRMFVTKSVIDVPMENMILRNPSFYAQIDDLTAGMRLLVERIGEMGSDPHLVQLSSVNGEVFTRSETLFNSNMSGLSSPSVFRLDQIYLMYRSRGSDQLLLGKSRDGSVWEMMSPLPILATSAVVFQHGLHYLLTTSGTNVFVSLLNPQDFSISDTRLLLEGKKMNDQLVDLKLATTSIDTKDSLKLILVNYATLSSNIKNWNVGYVLLNGTSTLNVVQIEQNPVIAEHFFDCPPNSNSTGIHITSCHKMQDQEYKCWYTQCETKIGVAKVKISFEK